MIHCKKCGNEIKENNKFCQKCGTPVEMDDIKEKKAAKAPVEKTPVEKAPPKPKEPVDEKTQKKRKAIAIFALIVLVLGFSTYKIGESLTSQDKVLERFFQAVSEQDTAGLANILVSSDIRLELNEENLKSFINYIDENPSHFDKLTTSLREQSEAINRSNPKLDRDQMVSARNEDNFNNYTIYLRKNGKKYFLYDNYEIVMQPFFVNISTNYGDVKIYIDDVELGVSTGEEYSKEFGPIVPGKHTVKGVYEGEYTTVEEVEDLYLISNNNYSSNNNILDYHMYLDMEHITIDTNFQDADVIVNGQKIDYQAGEFANTGLGPVTGDTTIQLSMDFPWGTITTEEKAVSEVGWYMDLYFDPINDKVREDIMAEVNKFLKDDIEALTARDASKYTNLMNPILEGKSNIIEGMLNSEQMYKAELRSSRFDLDSLVIGTDYKATIRCNINRPKVNYYGELEDWEFDDANDTYEYNLSYDQELDKWTIYSIYQQYYFNETNTKDFSFGNE